MNNRTKPDEVIFWTWFVFVTGLVVSVMVSLLGLLYFPLAILWVLPFFQLVSLFILIVGVFRIKSERKRLLVHLVVQVSLGILIVIVGIFLINALFNSLLF